MHGPKTLRAYRAYACEQEHVDCFELARASVKLSGDLSGKRDCVHKDLITSKWNLCTRTCVQRSALGAQEGLLALAHTDLMPRDTHTHTSSVA